MEIKTSGKFKQYEAGEYEKMWRENPNIFAIPCSYVPRMYVELEKYIKKAEKFKIPYSIEEMGHVSLYSSVMEKKYDCIIIKIDFEIKLNDWQFIATIDHLSGGNVLRSVWSADLPEKYRTSECFTCDHCGSNRFRTQTFIIYNEKTKEFKQVGRNCLKLYTGIDVSKVTAVFEIYNLFRASEGGGECEYDPDFCGGHIKRYLNIKDTLAITSEIVRIFGYVKKGSECSTVGRVIDAENYLSGDMAKYYPKQFAKYKKFIEENGIVFGTPENYEKADKIKEYILNQPAKNDYMHNLHMILGGDNYTDLKYRAFVVSAVAVYNRAMEEEAEFKKKHENDCKSEHVAEIGERVKNIVVTDFKTLYSYETEFGTMYFYKFVDKNGCIFTWKTSKYIDDVMAITGTVKAHSEYKGIKQTELTRCKIA